MKTKVIICNPHELQASLQRFFNQASKADIEIITTHQTMMPESTQSRLPRIVYTILYIETQRATEPAIIPGESNHHRDTLTQEDFNAWMTKKTKVIKVGDTISIAHYIERKQVNVVVTTEPIYNDYCDDWELNIRFDNGDEGYAFLNLKAEWELGEQ